MANRWVTACKPLENTSTLPSRGRRLATEKTVTRWGVLLAGALLVAAGCGPAGPKLGAVSGTITLDGEPLPLATVEFQPKFAGGVPSYATTDTSGRYTLRYTVKRWGAQLGPHVVRITTYRDEQGDGQPRRQIPERLPGRYHEQSELVREVVAGENKFDFELSSQ